MEIDTSCIEHAIDLYESATPHASPEFAMALRMEADKLKGLNKDSFLAENHTERARKAVLRCLREEQGLLAYYFNVPEYREVAQEYLDCQGSWGEQAWTQLEQEGLANPFSELTYGDTARKVLGEFADLIDLTTRTPTVEGEE